jgi:hypothetical protein
MAQGISNTNANAMLAAMSSYALFIGLNQSNPGITGAGEISANSYDRQPASWQAPNSGQLKAMAAGIPMRVPANSSPGFWSLWTQKSLGVFAAAGSFSTAEVFINPGTFTVQSLTYNLAII